MRLTAEMIRAATANVPGAEYKPDVYHPAVHCESPDALFLLGLQIAFAVADGNILASEEIDDLMSYRSARPVVSSMGTGEVRAEWPHIDFRDTEEGDAFTPADLGRIDPATATDAERAQFAKEN